MQKKTHSFLEACLNTATGFVISYAAGWIVFPWFGFAWTPEKGLGLTLIFTVISVIRSYAWRRIFNRHATKLRFDVIAHLHRQKEFSLRTFGPGTRTLGVVEHIRKELKEIEAKPDDLEEWIDVVILAMDGAWRTGAKPVDIVQMWIMKQEKNERRKWPDWRMIGMDKAIEHVRFGEDIRDAGLVTRTDAGRGAETAYWG
jgi:hypothetical protein